MERVKKDSVSIAWYKLADLIDRREREKALSVYRLLAHSFEDKAFSLQLEGDILWALDDKEALAKYRQSAFLYKKEKRLVDAICVCEHLVLLEPNSTELERVLLDLYVDIDWQEKCSERLLYLYEKFEKNRLTVDDIVKIVKSLFARACGEGDGRFEKKEWLKKLLLEQKYLLPKSILERIESIRPL
jgi:hypothetical protein